MRLPLLEALSKHKFCGDMCHRWLLHPPPKKFRLGIAFLAPGLHHFEARSLMVHDASSQAAEPGAALEGNLGMGVMHGQEGVGRGRGKTNVHELNTFNLDTEASSKVTVFLPLASVAGRLGVPPALLGRGLAAVEPEASDTEAFAGGGFTDSHSFGTGSTGWEGVDVGVGAAFGESASISKHSTAFWVRSFGGGKAGAGAAGVLAGQHRHT